MRTRPNRRTVVRTGCAVLASAVAGCLGADSNDDDSADTDTTTTASTTTDASTTVGTTTSTESGGDDQLVVAEFLSETSNFDGVVDRTGTDAVDVEVGVEANGAFYGFGPPAVRVDSGTTVTWTWTGKGGSHNVVARDGAEFESELTGETDHTFQQSFEAPGTVLYVCNPHEGTGMKGAVVVE